MRQLCGSVYAELYMLDKNESYLTDIKAVLGEEMSDAASTSNYWSLVDALHMAGLTYSRLANVTGDAAFARKQWMNFDASAIKGAVYNASYSLWNESDDLFYRDESDLGNMIYWSRGNGWAINTLVSAIEHGPADPHRADYARIFLKHAAKLKALQGGDGAWRASLLDEAGYPLGETTGTANFVHAFAWGINAGLLTAAEYLSVVEKGWVWLEGVALHSDGMVGNCRPHGSKPLNNFNSSSTSEFCVGLFLRAASQVARLSEAQTPVHTGMKLDDGDASMVKAALTPPLGWSNWNGFEMKFNASLLLNTAKELKKNGLAAKGYTLIQYGGASYPASLVNHGLPPLWNSTSVSDNKYMTVCNRTGYYQVHLTICLHLTICPSGNLIWYI